MKKCIETAMNKLLRRKRKAVTPEEKKQIEQVAEKMIQAATMDDVRKYDPAYHRLTIAAERVPARKAAACKKAATKRVSVTKRSVAKRVGVKNAAPRISTAKKRQRAR